MVPSQRNPKQQSSIGLTDDDHIVIVYPRYGSFGNKNKKEPILVGVSDWKAAEARVINFV